MKYMNEILFEAGATEYNHIANNDGKVWLIPSSNMRIGFELYQPSSLKGKILKELYPYLHRVQLVRKIIGTEKINLTFSSTFAEKINKIYQNSNLEYSIFLGTPSVHQKATIQISSGSQILGYCKVTDKKDIADIFSNENRTLKYLEEHGITNIPKCLYTGKITNNISIFVQSTVKTRQSTVIHDIRGAHISFLKKISEKTKCVCDYFHSDYFKTIVLLRNSLGYLPDKTEEMIVLRSIKLAEQELEKSEWFSFYHGDFTPWNIFFEQRNIFVFDFEYSKKSYPPMIDLFHYFTQTEIFEKQVDADMIYKDFLLMFVKGQFSNLFENPYMAYRYYLLDILALYLSRGNGHNSLGDARNISIWIKLLSKLEDNTFV